MNKLNYLSPNCGYSILIKLSKLFGDFVQLNQDGFDILKYCSTKAHEEI